MSSRLPPRPGEWIDRERTITFRFEGREYQGFAGDVLSGALWASGVRLLGRSFKYHRPRGLFSFANHDVNVMVEDESRTNLRGDVLPIREGRHEGAGGLYYDPADGSSLVLALEEGKLDDAAAVVATTAHEMCHIHLLGDGRVDPEDEDHEPLTDLLTVFFGLGVFTANAAFQFEQWEDGLMQGWSASTAGYLPEDAYGYSLALFALIRGEKKPPWASPMWCRSCWRTSWWNSAESTSDQRTGILMQKLTAC